jgi:hypothetical protein
MQATHKPVRDFFFRGFAFAGGALRRPGADAFAEGAAAFGRTGAASTGCAEGAACDGSSALCFGRRAPQQGQKRLSFTGI